MDFNTFPNGINPKENGDTEIRTIYFEVTVLHFNHCTKKTHLWESLRFWDFNNNRNDNNSQRTEI